MANSKPASSPPPASPSCPHGAWVVTAWAFRDGHGGTHYVPFQAALVMEAQVLVCGLPGCTTTKILNPNFRLRGEEETPS